MNKRCSFNFSLQFIHLQIIVHMSQQLHPTLIDDLSYLSNCENNSCLRQRVLLLKYVSIVSEQF